ncbi:MAG: hypothetical protein ACEQSB_03855 [Undibacterium sp.]
MSFSTYHTPRSVARFILLLFLIALSVLTFVWSYRSGFVTTYNDAMSHLNIARLVIDNQEPGLYQLGSVWLPFNHLLSLSLIWNDTLWHSGLAGSVFSMVLYVLSVIGIFYCLRLLTQNEMASVIGSGLFALNFNLLYLQTTPLTEVAYIALFVYSLLFFLLYLQRQSPRYLAVLGILGFLQLYSRYDGWFVVAIEGIVILVLEFVVRKQSIKDVIGKILVFSTPILFGAALWLLWNFLIYHNPLYFIYGPYSAHAQQEVIGEHSELLSKGSVYWSTLAYWYVLKSNVGSFVTALSLFALGWYFFQKEILLNARERIGFLFILVAPIVFNIIALYLGFSIIHMPELPQNSTGSFANQWFNVRYGILALPLAAIFAGILALRGKIPALIVVLVIVLQGVSFWKNEGVVTLIDGTIGASSFQQREVAEVLKNLAKPEDTILFSLSFHNPVAFRSGIPLKQFIYEGVSRQWRNALANPENYASLVVMSSNAPIDPVQKATLIDNKEHFLEFYELVYQGNEMSIYTRLPMDRWPKAGLTEI